MSRVVFTKHENIKRAEAEKILADPNATHWHRSRAETILARTRQAAEARAKQRDTQGAQPQRDIPPNGTSPEKWKEECERVEKFFEAVREGRIARHEVPVTPAPPPQSEKPAPSGEPRAVSDAEVCPLCLISKSLCGHGGQFLQAQS
jgi:hypothetical protein